MDASLLSENVKHNLREKGLIGQNFEKVLYTWAGL